MKTAGPESPFFHNVENQIKNAAEPNESWPEARLNFNNTLEMIQYVDDNRPIWSPIEQGSICNYVCQTIDESKTLGTKTWDEAAALARFGWPEGRNRLVAAQQKFVANDKVKVAAIGYDVAGAFPDVPLYLAGDPECMVDQVSTSRTSRPVIKLLISPMCAVNVSAEARANWGAALLSWVSAEEAAGNQVEIDILYVTTSPCFFIDEKKWGPPVVVTFSLQKTENKQSIDQLAFWLMHNAAHRRIQFAIRERLNIGKWYSLFNVYGNAVTDFMTLESYVTDNKILLILGDGASDVSSALKYIDDEVEKWKKRQAQ
jgi:hypothetical protein